VVVLTDSIINFNSPDMGLAIPRYLNIVYTVILPLIFMFLSRRLAKEAKNVSGTGYQLLNDTTRVIELLCICTSIYGIITFISFLWKMEYTSNAFLIRHTIYRLLEWGAMLCMVFLFRAPPARSQSKAERQEAIRGRQSASKSSNASGDYTGAPELQPLMQDGRGQSHQAPVTG